MPRSRFLLLLAALAAVPGCGEGDRPSPAAAFAAEPVLVSPEIAAFYRERGSRPLWVDRNGPRPAALKLAALVAGAEEPGRYDGAKIEAALDAARTGHPAARAQAELLLSRAYAALVRDAAAAPRDEDVTYVDESLAPEPAPDSEIMAAAAAAPDLAAHVQSAAAPNPLYGSLARGYARWRAAHPKASPAEQARVRANLERARAIPAHPGRYVIVDIASARLWMIDGGRVEGPMSVIVGKNGMETPQMAALIRHVTLNPYWNIPPDLARERARRVLISGPGFLQREGIEILSDWSDRPKAIAASKVDWKAVAAGRKSLRLRQRPGPANVMGAMKFMFPNALGIYLHDFPEKELFGRDDRRISSGCVRVADAPRLARFLFGGEAPKPAGPSPEQNVDLPEPVPVYLTYLTVLPDPKTGLSFRPDPYGKDKA